VRSANITAIVLILLSFGFALPASGWGPSQSDSQGEPENELTPEQVIQKFSEKETEFFEAWMNYTYTQVAKIRVLSVDNIPVNESLMLVSEVVFNDDGTREVHLSDRRGRLKSVTFTPEDEEIIYNLNPFALTVKELPLYNLKFKGKERVDELYCYVFSVTPKSTKGGRLYFDGKIWVDDVDLQIVRTVGKAVPETWENKFPEFETLRQVVDGKYWFPVWTHADETLRFPNQDVRIEETITYEGYKEFRSKTTIRYGKPVPSKDAE
jgi:hypothetical protein